MHIQMKRDWRHWQMTGQRRLRPESLSEKERADGTEKNGCGIDKGGELH